MTSLVKWLNFQKIFLLILLLLSAKLVYAQAQDEKVVIPRIPEEIKLDGIIDEATWNQAKQFHLVQNQPNFGKPPSEKTETFVRYTEDYLYVACKC